MYYFPHDLRTGHVHKTHLKFVIFAHLMPIVVLCGNRHIVNSEVLRSAASHTTALIIDGANAADPHTMLQYTKPENLDEIFVLETELIYKLRDAIVEISSLAKEADTNYVFFTTFDALFNYQDEEENQDVYRQVWLLLRQAAIKYHILVGVRAGSMQETYGRMYAKGAQWVTLS
jgi:hypothetical protein